MVRIETKEEEARFVFIAGQPLNEPIVQNDPFVMNTLEEIYETFYDFRNAVNGFERANQWRSFCQLIIFFSLGEVQKKFDIR